VANFTQHYTVVTRFGEKVAAVTLAYPKAAFVIAPKAC